MIAVAASNSPSSAGPTPAASCCLMKVSNLPVRKALLSVIGFEAIG
jgi:hypothetical protein